MAIASEHDDVAGTVRGPNTIFRFALDGVTFAHLGDFGQPALRPEQRAAIGEVDVLFVPVGEGPTIGGEPAAALVRSLAPRLVVPMHYRTAAVNFLEPPDAFLAALGADVTRLETSDGELDDAARDGCCSSGGAVRAAARVTRESGSPAANQVQQDESDSAQRNQIREFSLRARASGCCARRA